jgi:hypothetical protein
MFADAAIVAVAAGGGDKGVNDEIAGFDIGDTLADFFYVAGCFVTGDCR